MRYPSLRTAGRLALVLVVAALTGCASAGPPLLLVPTPTQRSATYYQHGQPIASVASESTSVLLSVDDVTLFGTQYLRVWLLYFNRMNHPVLLDPIQSVMARASVAVEPARRSHAAAATAEAGDDSVLTHIGLPELPYKLMDEAETAKSRDMITTVIGGALQSAGEETGTHAAVASTDAIARHTSRQVDDIRAAHEMFAASLNAGVLKKHTAFPQTGVDGYLYIPLKLYSGEGKDTSERSLANDMGWKWPAKSITYTVLLNLPGLTDSVTFTPGTGE